MRRGVPQNENQKEVTNVAEINIEKVEGGIEVPLRSKDSNNNLVIFTLVP